MFTAAQLAKRPLFLLVVVFSFFLILFLSACQNGPADGSGPIATKPGVGSGPGGAWDGGSGGPGGGPGDGSDGGYDDDYDGGSNHCAALSSFDVQATSESVQIPNGPKVAVWVPSGVSHASSCSFPLLLFSHGLGSCGTSYSGLTQAFANAGFIVVAPDHADCKTGIDLGQILTNPDSWTDANYANRRDDMRKALDWATSQAWFASAVDTSRIGAMGHSLGGYTSLGLAGAWPSWYDPRIKAVLAMAPHVAPYLADREIANVRVPIMFQGATGDFLITPFLTGSNGGFALATAEKYLVMLNGGSHSSWATSSGTEAQLIRDYGIAFFRKHLLGENPARLKSKDPALSDYQYVP